MDVDFDLKFDMDFEPNLDELEKYLFSDEADEETTTTRKRSRSDGDANDETPSAKRTIFDVLDDEEDLDEEAANLSWRISDEEAESAVMSILKFEQMSGDDEEYAEECRSSAQSPPPPAVAAAAAEAQPVQQPQLHLQPVQPEPLQQAQHAQRQQQPQLLPVKTEQPQQRRVQRQFCLIPDQLSAKKQQQQRAPVHAEPRRFESAQFSAKKQQPMEHAMYRRPAQYPMMDQPQRHLQPVQHHPHHAQHPHHPQQHHYAPEHQQYLPAQHHQHHAHHQQQWTGYDARQHHHVAHEQHSTPFPIVDVAVKEHPFNDPFFMSLPVSDEVPFEVDQAAPETTHAARTQPETTQSAARRPPVKTAAPPRKRGRPAKQTAIEDYFPQRGATSHPYPTPQASPDRFPAPAAVAAPAISDAEICLTVLCSALNKKKLPVTVGEIRRRMAAPECMDIAAVGRLTRHAKHSKSALQRSLIKCDFSTDEHDFVQPFNTRTISCLLEADAMTLAGDYRKVMTHQLPTDVIRAIIVDAAGPAFHTHNDAIMQHLHRVKDHFVSAGRVPSQARLDPTNADQAAMHRFSLETHGFGPAAAIAVMDALTVVFTTPICTSEFAQKPPPSDVDARLLAHPDDDAHVFDQGVIARVAFDCKIPVTNGELRRRVFGPEKAQASDVCTYLRKAKGKNTLPELRESLYNVGIEVIVDRMIKKTNTVFALVTEQESMALARETAERLAALPPSAKILQGAREHPEAALAIRKITAALAAAMVRVGATPAEARAENEQDRHILRFAMYSHHFGHNYYASVMRWMNDVFAQVC